MKFISRLCAFAVLAVAVLFGFTGFAQAAGSAPSVPVHSPGNPGAPFPGQIHAPGGSKGAPLPTTPRPSPSISADPTPVVPTVPPAKGQPKASLPGGARTGGSASKPPFPARTPNCKRDGSVTASLSVNDRVVTWTVSNSGPTCLVHPSTFKVPETSDGKFDATSTPQSLYRTATLTVPTGDTVTVSLALPACGPGQADLIIGRAPLTITYPAGSHNIKGSTVLTGTGTKCSTVTPVQSPPSAPVPPAHQPVPVVHKPVVKHAPKISTALSRTRSVTAPITTADAAPRLAQTGFNVVPLIVSGLILLVAGVIFLLLGRIRDTEKQKA